MIFLDEVKQMDSKMPFVMEDVRTLRIHPDVLTLVKGLVEDDVKLEKAAPFLFMPAYRTWIEWEDNHGKIAFFYDGAKEQSVSHGYGLWCFRRHEDSDPNLIACRFDIPEYRLTFAPEMGVDPALASKLIPSSTKFDMTDRILNNQRLATLRPIVWAVLALINSPKVIRQAPVDLHRLNKRRQALGRYTFHPHHEVRLNVDKRSITTTSGSGDGASKALHFVRSHLRLVPHLGQYTLVSPHWRGDPALGIRDTHYAVERQNSKWKD